ncbi:hypothetical protein KUCAC02_023930 [Chaenocephalus aceratus]|uniref:Uncharacterized protein n=1 Tax=Chaenocephalus aceratus TaxID=36190 RepID=A0ACB9WH09_CHAAC|nr:hypothetical protein KUCAC02_023930 [Chaenocephalus aceratus]
MLYGAVSANKQAATAFRIDRVKQPTRELTGEATDSSSAFFVQLGSGRLDTVILMLSWTIKRCGVGTVGLKCEVEVKNKMVS